MRGTGLKIGRAGFESLPLQRRQSNGVSSLAPGLINSSVKTQPCLLPSQAPQERGYAVYAVLMELPASCGHFRLRTESRERELGMPQLTHPDFTKLPRPKFPDQLERLPGDFPFVLGPGILRGWVHTRQGQLLTQTVPFLCFREEKRVLEVTRADTS